MKLNQDQLEQARKEYIETRTRLSKIAKKYSVSDYILLKELKETYGLSIDNRLDYRCQKAYEDYSTTDIKLIDILKKWGLGNVPYYNYLKKLENNLPREKNVYQVNSNYFNEMNSEEKAYLYIQ